MLVQDKSITKTRGFKHLSTFERGAIHSLLKEGKSYPQIGCLLGRTHQTISNEVKRGTYSKRYYNSVEEIYNPIFSHNKYLLKRENSGPKLKYLKAKEFIEYAVKQMKKEKWSPKAVVGRAKLDPKWLGKTLVCPCTLYSYIALRIRGKDTGSVKEGLERIKGIFASSFSKVFKSITSDNGSEFSALDSFLKPKGTKVFFAHPYSSFERGSNERHNGLLSRYIRKGIRIDSVAPGHLYSSVSRLNNLPRETLLFKTPHELFYLELKKLKLSFKNISPLAL